MVWNGCHDLVILEIDEDGYVLQEYIIKNGGWVPDEALKLLKKAKEVEQTNDGFVAVSYEKAVKEESTIKRRPKGDVH